MRIYISGPMSGIDNFNRHNFDFAAQLIKQAGVIPLNPAIFPDGLSQSEYMRLDMLLAEMSESFFVLDGFEQSKGALAEIALANKLEKPVYYQSKKQEDEPGFIDDIRKTMNATKVDYES